MIGCWRVVPLFIYTLAFALKLGKRTENMSQETSDGKRDGIDASLQCKWAAVLLANRKREGSDVAASSWYPNTKLHGVTTQKAPT